MDNVSIMVDLKVSIINRSIFIDNDSYQRKNIFATCWLFLCHESQLSGPGDFITTNTGVEVPPGRQEAHARWLSAAAAGQKWLKEQKV